MSYREFAPPERWAHIVECVWTCARTPEHAATHTVLPDGAMDVIASFDSDGDVVEAQVVGAMSKPAVVTVSAPQMVGLRFLPGRGGTALRTEASKLTDATVSLHDVIGRPNNVRDAIRDALRALATDASNATAINRLAHSLSLESVAPPIVRAAVQSLGFAPQLTRIDSLSRAVGASRQQLARLFATHVGVTPKQFARICRVRALLSESRRTNAPWSQIAFQFGYTDQSHLIADVRSVTGMTPGQWRSETGSIFPISPVPTPRD